MTVEETNIRALLDRIKREGIEKAEQEAQDIVERARAQAEERVNQAREDSEKMIAEAEEEIRRKQQAFESQLRQAGRDLVISVKHQIVNLMQRLLEREVRRALSPDLLQEIIPRAIGRWKDHDASEELEVLLGTEDLDRLEEAFIQGLQKELRSGVSLRPVDSIEAGFRIGEKDGDLYYDFTDRGIAEMLSAYLNPRVATFLKDREAAENRKGK